MTIPETYCKHYGMRIESGNGNQVLLPFLVLDIMQQIFFRDIYPLKMKFEMNRAKKTVASEYKKFNSLFWQIFDEGQTDTIIEIMDDFEATIEEPLADAKAEILNQMKDMPGNTSGICASMDLCNILAQLAMLYWNDIFSRTVTFAENLHINSLVRNTAFLVKRYFASNSCLKLNQNNDKVLGESIDRLIAAITSFVNNLHAC